MPVDRWTTVRFAFGDEEICEDAAIALARVVNRGVVQDVDEQGHYGVTVYLTPEEDEAGLLERLKSLTAQIARRAGTEAPEPEVSSLQDRDWNSEWKRHYSPVRVGERLLVVPSWEELEPSGGEVIIRIDPGQAFGTGTHATTIMVMEMMESLWASGSFGPNWLPWVLDVGTGTGILAILAAKLGASSVEAIDVDPLAVSAARINSSLNGVEGKIIVSSTPLDEVGSTFTLVTANLDAPTLLSIRQSLIDAVAPGGLLLVSGVLKYQGAEVEAAFAGERGMMLEERRQSGEWIALQLRKS